MKNDLLPINLFYYGGHSREIDTRIINARPQYIIGNTPHGLWGEIQGYDRAWLMRDIAAFQAEGIKVIGYLTAGYEGFHSGGGLLPSYYSLETAQKLIRNMAEIDRVDGVFIDETSKFPDEASQKYLRTLTDLAHSYGLIAWGNPGESEFDAWYFNGGGFDLMQSTEKWRGQSPSLTQQKWGKRVSVAGFSPSYTAETASRLTLDAWRKGIRYCYVTHDEYASLAPWFEEYVSLLKAAKRSIF